MFPLVEVDLGAIKWQLPRSTNLNEKKFKADSRTYCNDQKQIATLMECLYLKVNWVQTDAHSSIVYCQYFQFYKM